MCNPQAAPETAHAGNAMGATTRTFIAVEIDERTAARAATIIEQLRTAGADVNWVSPRNLHLTLKFLGDVPNELLPAVIEAVQEAARRVPPFTLEVRGVGAFPQLDRPRTVWLGVGQGGREMQRLAQAIEQSLRPLGFAPEARGFTAHLTIGRVRRPSAALRALAELMRRHSEQAVGTVAVEQVAAVASTLTPRGPIYEALGRAPLSDEAADRSG